MTIYNSGVHKVIQKLKGTRGEEWVGGPLIFVNDGKGHKCQGTGLGEQKG